MTSILFNLNILGPAVICVYLCFNSFYKNANTKKTQSLTICFSEFICAVTALELISYTNILVNLPYRHSFILWNEYFNLALISSFNIWFILLTVLLVYLCLFFILDEPDMPQVACLVATKFFLIKSFTTTTLLAFYIFFEATLIPMFLLIGLHGSRDRKSWAGLLLIYYTVGGSACFLAALIYLLVNFGTTDVYTLFLQGILTDTETYFIWLALFIAFAAKIPLFPFHIWLPEAHVEAPTTGSVLLAGIILKLGTFGLIKFVLPLSFNATIFFAPYIITLALVGALFAATIAIRQTDMKRIVAYSSVSHMGVGLAALMTYTKEGVVSATIGGISHGFISAALFFAIGIIYKRYKTRTAMEYRGLYRTHPLFAALFFYLIFANMGQPGLGSFPSEFAAIACIFQLDPFLGALAAATTVVVPIFSLTMLANVLFGVTYNNIKKFKDINAKESFCILLLLFYSQLMGLFPDIWVIAFQEAAAHVSHHSVNLI